MVQYSVHWVDLNPTQGAEMQKVRPCVVISPTEANRHFRTVLAAPVTGTDLGLPTRHKISVADVSGFVALDQLRALEKTRFREVVGQLSVDDSQALKQIIKEFLVD